MPTATVPPAIRLGQGRQALYDGEYETAAALLEGLRSESDDRLARECLLALAQAYRLAGRNADVVKLLATSDLPSLNPAEEEEAWGLLARCYEALGRWPEAITAYERLLEHNETLAYEVRQRMAAGYSALGLQAKRLEQLLAIPLTELETSKQAVVLEELAATYVSLGDYPSALATYDRILGFARLASYRATVLCKKGRALVSAGRDEEAMAVFEQVVNEYPQTWGAYEALTAMDAETASLVNDLQRGQILYHAGQYEASIAALKRYQRENPHGQWSTAGYYRGLAYAALGQADAAQGEFDAVIRRFPESAVIGDVWMAKAGTTQASGGDPVPIYAEFARRYPEHARAAEALWLAARSCEGAGNWRDAARYYRSLRTEYGEGARVPEAFFREGLAAYALGDYELATDLWEERVASALSGEERARTLTWLGLAAAHAGDEGLSAAHWRAAAESAPRHYYGLRAGDLLEGVALELPAGPGLPAVEEWSPSEADWAEIEAWVGTWAEEGQEASGAIEGSSLARRADALWRLGWHDEALEVYRAFRDEVSGDPWALTALTKHCQDLRVYAMAISCAERLLSLGAESLAPPEALRRLAYPTSYAHLIRAEGAPEDVDPLLFLSLIRQESRFNPVAVSSAGALGLSQVMPATGAWIAERIGPTGWTESMLLRPALNVRYGTWYLSWALSLYGRNWLAALAAYNAGPTNVVRWTGGLPVDDPDLFYETIPISETRTYLARVYEGYRAYQELYGGG